VFLFLIFFLFLSFLQVRNRGFVTLQDVTEAAGVAGQWHPALLSSLRQAFLEVDTNNDGRVDLRDFCSLFPDARSS
jgi:hypothetical protein